MDTTIFHKFWMVWHFCIVLLNTRNCLSEYDQNQLQPRFTVSTLGNIHLCYLSVLVSILIIAVIFGLHLYSVMFIVHHIHVVLACPCSAVALLTLVQSVQCTAGPSSDGAQIANYDTWRTENSELEPCENSCTDIYRTLQAPLMVNDLQWSVTRLRSLPPNTYFKQFLQTWWTGR